MLQLLSPAGLWALATLTLPLAVHLWRPPPRTVRLGSLRGLENLPRRMRHPRWRERALLAARLGLLALLALLLAGPRWQHAPPHGPQRWLLLDPAARPSGGSLTRLDELRAAGYETFVPAPGSTPDLWSLMREADAELPAGSSLAVFSPGRLASLRGTRPAMRHCRVEWVPTPEAPEPSAPGKPTSASSPPDVLILHDADRAVEARTLAAAIRAAGPARIQVKAVYPEMGYSEGMGWIFLLSAQPAPSAWTARGANVFSETAGDVDRTQAIWVVSDDATFVDPARLWQRVTPPGSTTPGAAWWTDGFGRPLLTKAREGRGWHWRFFGRFDPAWTDLTRGGAFPGWLRALMFARGDDGPDRRLADPSQCPPAQTPPGGREVVLSRVGETGRDLHGPLWALAAALFGLERAWSLRRRRAPAPTPEPVTANAVVSR